MSNSMKEFFDRLAPSWDEGESFREEERKALISRLPIKEGDRLLDIACGTGILEDQLYSLSKQKVIGVDLSEEMIKIAKKKRDPSKAEYFQSDFSEWESELSFDGAVIYNAYPHILDRVAFKKKLLRYLKKGAFFAIVHNQGREELHEQHSSPAAKLLSRDLSSPKEEASYYQDAFKILLAEESDHYFLIILEKL